MLRCGPRLWRGCEDPAIVERVGRWHLHPRETPFTSRVLALEPDTERRVSLRPQLIQPGSPRHGLVTFMHYDLGYFDDDACRLEPIENPFGPKVLLMSPE